MAAWLFRRITPEQRRHWRVTDPRAWISEPAALRDRAYPAPSTDGQPVKLGFEYT